MNNLHSFFILNVVVQEGGEGKGAAVGEGNVQKTMVAFIENGMYAVFAGFFGRFFLHESRGPE
jgi:hypothetical protein